MRKGTDGLGSNRATFNVTLDDGAGMDGLPHQGAFLREIGSLHLTAVVTAP